MPRSFLPVIILLPGLLLLGCCHCRDSHSARQPFSIELSSGGGFSGLWNGYILHSDGTVQWWEGKQTKTDGVKTLGDIDPDDVLDIKTLIDRDGILRLPLRETGNMTTMLRVITGDEMQFITWPGTLDEDTQAPAEVRHIYAQMRKLIDPFRAPRDR